MGTLFLAVPSPASGYLLPGQWAYYQLTLDPSDASWMVSRAKDACPPHTELYFAERQGIYNNL